METAGLCGRPTKKETPCRATVPSGQPSCTQHLTVEEGRRIDFERIESDAYRRGHEDGLREGRDLLSSSLRSRAATWEEDAKSKYDPANPLVEIVVRGSRLTYRWELGVHPKIGDLVYVPKPWWAAGGGYGYSQWVGEVVGLCSTWSGDDADLVAVRRKVS